jgi:hypothetical protein
MRKVRITMSDFIELDDKDALVNALQCVRIVLPIQTKRNRLLFLMPVRNCCQSAVGEVCAACPCRAERAATKTGISREFRAKER